MKKAIVLMLMLGLGLAIPVNAIFKAKTVPVPAPVTKTNYVACAVVGGVILALGIVFCLGLHMGNTPSAVVAPKIEDVEAAILERINTDLVQASIKVIPLSDGQHYGLQTFNCGKTDDVKDVNLEQLKNHMQSTCFSVQQA